MPFHRPTTTRARGGRRTATTIAAVAMLVMVPVACSSDAKSAASTSTTRPRTTTTSTSTTIPPTTTTRPDPTPAIAWKDCGSGFECGTLTVPVDYSAPDTATLDLAVSRLPARDPGHRIGSLVMNFGGPGDPGAETLHDFASTMPAAIRQRFDLVSFDPRGTGTSKPIDCVDDATMDKVVAQDPTPDTDAELPTYYKGDLDGIDMVAACIAKNGDWLAHVGTRNVARDVNQLRRALGEEKLTYLGFSYGTVIGAVYAQQFPSNVRALVLDGAVNLSATRLDEATANAVGFEHALKTFLDDCASRPSCAFRSGGDPRAALDRLRDRFERGLTLPASYRYRGGATREGRVGVGGFYLGILAGLYDQSSWPTLARALSDATKDDGHLLLAFADAYTGRAVDGHFDNRSEAISMINCADDPTPTESEDAFAADLHTFARAYPFWGRWIAAAPLGCDVRLPRPTAAEVLGDVRTTGAPPVLVVGTTDDPVTPFAGAQDMATRLGGSVLLTARGTQHAAYAKGNACVDDAVDAYLIDLTLPAPGTVCG